jgi:2-keto-4-pentenoate hydratase/2-oxohepta-3-ene-1,7-dioic acid hydratase in catechol pathway
MRLVTYRSHVEAEARLGALVGPLVLDLELFGEECGVPLPSSMLEFIDLGPQAVAITSKLIDEAGGIFPIGTAVPVAELPRQPVIFSKPPTSVIGPDDAIVHNAKITQQLDWEVELAAIIGTRAKGVSREDALNYVFGYTVCIDMSARDCRRAGQWIYSKGQDTFAPMGPCVVTADEIPDPQTLDLWLTVNGVEKQRSNTAYMLFKVDELVADISQGITLEPGDIIATGTPAGVGAGMDPQEWLWPGDVVVASVEGIGTLRHPIVAG